jgi:hypothetical protein
MMDRAKLASRGPLLELLPNMGIRCFPHAAIERRFQKVAPVQHGGTLEEMIAGIGHSLLRRLFGFVSVSLFLLMLARLSYDPVGLMSMLRRQLTMPLQDFFRREQLLAVSGAVRRYLSGSRTVDSRFPEMVLDLFAARA